MPDFLQNPIGIAGTGNVAQALGRVLAGRGARIAAVGGRDPQHTRQAAAFIGGSTRPVTLAQLPEYARHVLIAVADSAIPAVAATLAAAGLKGFTVLHTCGGLGPEALSEAAQSGASCGVLHPLQTIMSPEQGERDIPGIAFGVTGCAPALEWAEWLARLAGGTPLRIPQDSMALYHAAAVIAGNYTIALMDAAAAALARTGIAEQDALQALGPLARASLDNALRCGPGRAITGPIARGDAHTVSVHLQTLEAGGGTVPRLYRAAGLQVLDIVRRRGALPAPAAAQMEHLLEGQGGRL